MRLVNTNLNELNQQNNEQIKINRHENEFINQTDEQHVT